MKLACVIPVYNEENLIRGCIENIEPYVDKILVLVSQKPYYRDYEPQDNTAKIASDMGCDVIEGVWDEEHKQRNTGNIVLANYDWILSMDADMRYTKANIRKLIDHLKVTKADAVMVQHYCYWKEHDKTLDDDFAPVVAARPQVRYISINNPMPGFNLEFFKDSRVHHFCWSEPKDVLKKVLTFGHANEFDGQEWYDKFFKNSDNGYATLPNGQKRKILEGHLPDELKRFI